MTDVATFATTHAHVLRDAPPNGLNFMDAETMMAVGAHVQREYGITGYVIRPLDTDRHAGLFLVQHSDGSTFRLWADRWGNVARVPDAS